MSENGLQSADAATPAADMGAPRQISIAPDSIKPNPSNPRQFFRPETIEQLASSIREVGVLVPLTVYQGSEEGVFVLLDGERRWRAAKLINYPEIPAWVVDEPDEVKNTVLMFNIHMLREEWPQIAAAWALKELMERSGEEDNETLSRLTGLSSSQVRSMKTVLAFPEEWQYKIARQELPYNFPIELNKAVLRWTRDDPEAVLNKSEEELRKVFLDKYESGAVTDVVEFRKVGRIIKLGRREGSAAEQARSAFSMLITEPDVTIEEAYQASAAASYELRRVLRDIDALPDRLGSLLGSDLLPEQRDGLTGAMTSLRDRLGELL
jgi:ParB/RepB/Spo0J family partition protein